MKDNRDPQAVGELLVHLHEHQGQLAMSELADRALSRYPLPLVRGDESPLERYGDPRLYDVTVTTTIERTPIARLAAGPTG